MFHDPVFADVLRASEEKLSTLPISFHGPYAQTEHSRPKGTPAYERSMGFYREMLPFAKRLHSSYVNGRCVGTDDLEGGTRGTGRVGGTVQRQVCGLVAAAAHWEFFGRKSWLPRSV